MDIPNSLADNIKFNVGYEYDEENKIVMFIDGYDCVVTGHDINDAKSKLIADLKEYAQQYFEDVKTWSTDSKRAGQINELLKITICTDDELIECLICEPSDT